MLISVQFVVQLMKSESDARVMAKYKDLIDRGRKQFAEELDSIMPDVKLGNRGMTLKYLLLSSMRSITQLPFANTIMAAICTNKLYIENLNIYKETHQPMC